MRRTLVPSAAALLVAGGLALSRPASGQAIITNGTVRLGVDDLGQLNIGGGPPSQAGNPAVGVRRIVGGVEYEYTADGCLCEGWGAAADGMSGFANNAAGIGGLTLVSFGSTATTATSVVTVVGTGLKITHHYKPSASPDLYEGVVTIENTGADVADLRYRRVMDWDIEPTPFDELVTINGNAASAVLHTSDDGFESGDPLSSFSGILVTDTDVVKSGPADHGALFDFGFGPLAAGATKTFSIFYGGALSTKLAFDALGAVAAEDVYSFGYPNPGERPDGIVDTVAIFAFKGVGGTVIPPNEVPEPGTLAMLAGLGISGSLFVIRRRK
jgi:hypothetical protein